MERLVQLLVILLAAKGSAEVMARLHQPAVIGELIAGMVIGGSALGWVDVESGDLISILAEIGVILLLFEVGLETDLGAFVRLGPTSALVAAIGVVTPFALGYGASLAMGLGDGSTEVALYMGAAMTATSVGITARVFADLRRLHTDEARTIIGAAVIDDVIGLIILAAVAGVLGGDGGFGFGSIVWITVKAIAFLAAVVAIGRLVTPLWFRFLAVLRVEGTFVVGAFVFAIAVGLAADWLADLEPIVGAFAAGLVAGQTHFSDRIHSELRPIVFLFVPIFFLSIGAEVDVGVLTDPRTLGAGLVIAVLAIAGKMVAGLGVRGKGIDPLVVGVGMAPRGEVGLIFVALAADRLSAVVGPEETAIVVLMVLVTTIAAPLVLNRMLRSANAADVTDGEDEAQVRRLMDNPAVGGDEEPVRRPDDLI